VTAAPWPTELRLNKAKDRLTVAFDDGVTAELPAEYLRVMSPSAEVRGHAPGERKTVPGKARVRIADLKPVGNYAVRIVFDDGHDTGLYAWELLHELWERREDHWQEYLAELAEKGLSRD